MSLLSIIIALVVLGVVLWLVNRAPFIDGNIKQVITWVAVAVVVIWLLKASGLLASLGSITV